MDWQSKIAKNNSVRALKIFLRQNPLNEIIPNENLLSYVVYRRLAERSL
jgi:hypothetical protein